MYAFIIFLKLSCTLILHAKGVVYVMDSSICEPKYLDKEYEVYMQPWLYLVKKKHHF